MQGRDSGNVKLNIFQKFILKQQNKRFDRKLKRIKSVHNVDLGESENLVVRTEFKTKKEYKDYTKSMKGVLGRKNYRYKKLKSGSSIKETTLKEIESRVAEINYEYKERKSKIVLNARKHLKEEVADMIERDIEELNKKKRTRMVSGDFADLIELNSEKIVNGIKNEEDAIRKLTELIDNDYYNLNKRDEMYRKNYVKAIYNTYGDNSDTRKLEDLIMSLDIEEFMFGYYNPYSNTQLKDIYDPKQIEEYVEYLSTFYAEQKGLGRG